MFLPNIVTPVVSALFLRWIFIGRWGLISGLLIGWGIFPPDFLGDPFWARITVVLADAWQFTPFMILVLYAGLNTVDQSQIEAAQIDGAGIWTLLFRIMLPSIRPLIVFVLAIRLMDAFRFFDTIYVLTGGGPGTATETVTIYTYALAFRLLQIGKASALGVLTLLFVATLVAAMIRIVYRREKERSDARALAVSVAAVPAVGGVHRDQPDADHLGISHLHQTTGGRVRGAAAFHLHANVRVPLAGLGRKRILALSD